MYLLLLRAVRQPKVVIEHEHIGPQDFAAAAALRQLFAGHFSWVYLGFELVLLDFLAAEALKVVD